MQHHNVTTGIPAVDSCEVALETLLPRSPFALLRALIKHFSTYPHECDFLWITLRCKVLHTCG